MRLNTYTNHELQNAHHVIYLDEATLKEEKTKVYGFRYMNFPSGRYLCLKIWDKRISQMRNIKVEYVITIVD